jgi:hypothetical protein
MRTVSSMPENLSDFSLRVIGAVKAELARRDMTALDLVEPLRMNRNTIYGRLRGERPFETEEMEAIARHLGITVELLLASADLGNRSLAAAS